MWGWGVLISSLGCFFTSLSIIVQKVSWQEGVSYNHACAMWCAGLAVMIIAIVFNAWSLRLAPLAILAPLSGETVVWNVLLAVYCLGERTNLTELSAVGLILSGIVMVVVFGPHDPPEQPQSSTLELEKHRFTSDPRMLYYFLCIGFVMVGTLVVILHTEKKKRWYQSRLHGLNT